MAIATLLCTFTAYSIISSLILRKRWNGLIYFIIGASGIAITAYLYFLVHAEWEAWATFLGSQLGVLVGDAMSPRKPAP